MRPSRISRFPLFVIVVVTVVALIGFGELRDMQERLERAQVEATVRNLNSALQYEVAHRIAAGQENTIAELAGANPVPWLQAPLPGYLGEVAVAPSETTRGSWFFDRSRGELVYRPVLSRHLEGAGSPPLLKWRIQRPQRPGRLALTGGLGVVATVQYRWY
jgi:hypothetical protein